MAEKWQVKDHESEKRLVNRRLVVAGMFVGLLFIALFSQMIYLQVLRYDYFAARSDDNRLHSQYVPPTWG